MSGRQGRRGARRRDAACVWRVGGRGGARPRQSFCCCSPVARGGGGWGAVATIGVCIVYTVLLAAAGGVSPCCFFWGGPYTSDRCMYSWVVCVPCLHSTLSYFFIFGEARLTRPCPPLFLAGAPPAWRPGRCHDRSGPLQRGGEASALCAPVAQSHPRHSRYEPPSPDRQAPRAGGHQPRSAPRSTARRRGQRQAGAPTRPGSPLRRPPLATCARRRTALSSPAPAGRTPTGRRDPVRRGRTGGTA